MTKIATIILNRNLPIVTDKLHDHILQNNDSITDIYVVESGSSSDNLSRYCTWHANWDEANKQGLRYPRGMNFGLYNLWKENKLDKYDAFFLLTNDTEFATYNYLGILYDILKNHKRLGIISPCSKRWGEKILLKKNKTKYFWFIHSPAYLLKKEFLIDVLNFDSKDHNNFLYDGDNFRGYGVESELIAKAYCNDWAAGITSEVIFNENEMHLQNKFRTIITEDYHENLRLYIEEGKTWMKQKYGFKSKWTMQLYVKNFYDNFFTFYPELIKYKI